MVSVERKGVGPLANGDASSQAEQSRWPQATCLVDDEDWQEGILGSAVQSVVTCSLGIDRRRGGNVVDDQGGKGSSGRGTFEACLEKGKSAGTTQPAQWLGHARGVGLRRAVGRVGLDFGCFLRSGG
jgi:hypothetical protein